MYRPFKVYPVWGSTARSLTSGLLCPEVTSGQVVPKLRGASYTPVHAAGMGQEAFSGSTAKEFYGGTI
jgi:hypothetical protein